MIPTGIREGVKQTVAIPGHTFDPHTFFVEVTLNVEQKMIVTCAVTLMILGVAPPAPPGASMVEVDLVRAEFQAQGDPSEYPPSRRQSIATRFSSYTGIAAADIAVFVTDDPINANIVDVRVDHAIPTGTSAASIASTLNNGILRGVDVLQVALTQTGGTIVTTVFAAMVATRYVAVYPPPIPGPAFTETMVIVITVGGVFALVALIFIARECDAQRLNEFTRLVLGVFSRFRWGGGGEGTTDGTDRTTPKPKARAPIETPPPSPPQPPPSPDVIVPKRSVKVGASQQPPASVEDPLKRIQTRKRELSERVTPGTNTKDKP